MGIAVERTAGASVEEEDEEEARSAAELCGAVIRIAILGNSAIIRAPNRLIRA